MNRSDSRQLPKEILPINYLAKSNPAYSINHGDVNFNQSINDCLPGQEFY